MIGSQSRCRLRSLPPWLRNHSLKLIRSSSGSPSWHRRSRFSPRPNGLVPRARHWRSLSIQSSWGVVKKALRPLNGAPIKTENPAPAFAPLVHEQVGVVFRGGGSQRPHLGASRQTGSVIKKEHVATPSRIVWLPVGVSQAAHLCRRRNGPIRRNPHLVAGLTQIHARRDPPDPAPTLATYAPCLLRRIRLYGGRPAGWRLPEVWPGRSIECPLRQTMML